jgi:ZIP family zinc transporter
MGMTEGLVHSSIILMNHFLEIVLFTAAAGACIPLGGAIARIERIRPLWLEREFRHFVIAFGGGVLLAAVALVLIPEGVSNVSGGFEAGLSFICGGVCFFLLERYLGIRRREAPQFSAMLLDYIPESLALGGIFALNAASAPLLAVLIGLQNLPEGFNAYRELIASEGARPGRILVLMCALVPIGPVFGVSGRVFLTGYESALGAIMLFASGGILYLIFQDIAPQARMRRHWAPPLGAVCGFALALMGQTVITGI